MIAEQKDIDSLAVHPRVQTPAHASTSRGEVIDMLMVINSFSHLIQIYTIS